MYWISDPLPYIFPAVQVFDIFVRLCALHLEVPPSDEPRELPTASGSTEELGNDEFRDGFHLQKWWTYGWFKNQTWCKNHDFTDFTNIGGGLTGI